MKKLLSTLALIGATACALLAAPAVRAEGNFPLDRAPITRKISFRFSTARNCL